MRDVESLQVLLQELVEEIASASGIPMLSKAQDPEGVSKNDERPRERVGPRVLQAPAPHRKQRVPAVGPTPVGPTQLLLPF